MPDTKISALTALLGSALAGNDLLPIVDTSAVLTKSITVQEFLTGILGSTGISGATVTTDNPLLNLTQTWNANILFTAAKIHASGGVLGVNYAAGSRLLDLWFNGGSAFHVTCAGDVVAPSGEISALRYVASQYFLAQSIYLRNDSALLRMGVSDDLILARDAANILAQRNGTNAQTFNIYNTFTDASNFETGFLKWAGNVFNIGTTYNGTGANRPISFLIANVARWNIDTSGHFMAATDNTFDIGASGVTRPRTGYFGTSLFAPTFQTPDTTVAGLPAAAAGNKGQRRHVTDATAPAFLATVAGGGAVVTPVFSNGANWIVG